MKWYQYKKPTAVLVILFLVSTIIGAIFFSLCLLDSSYSLDMIVNNNFPLKSFSDIISSAKWELLFLILTALAGLLPMRSNAIGFLTAWRGFLYGICGMALLPNTDRSTSLLFGLFLLRNSLFFTIWLINAGVILSTPLDYYDRNQIICLILSTTSLLGLSLLIQYLFVFSLFQI